MTKAKPTIIKTSDDRSTPILPEDGQSDSNTSGDDSHPDDYHRKKRRQAKSRPAPPSSSFREVPKKKKTKPPSPPPESDDEQQDYSMFYNMYPLPMTPGNQQNNPASGFSDDGSDDEESYQSFLSGSLTLLLKLHKNNIFTLIRPGRTSAPQSAQPPAIVMGQTAQHQCLNSHPVTKRVVIL